METAEREDLEQQLKYWEERAVKAEQRLLQQQENQSRGREVLTNQLAQAESRCNILQAEIERLHMLLETQQDFPRTEAASPGEDLATRLSASEERCRIYENELREVHYKVADRLIKEGSQGLLRDMEIRLDQSVPMQRTEQLLDRYYRLLAYAESLRQQLVQVEVDRSSWEHERGELQRQLLTRPAGSEDDGELKRLAFQDSLTELPNLALLKRFLDQELEKARGGSHSVGLGCLDMDRLRSINLTLGVEVGDSLIASIAKRLQGQLKPEEVLARGRDDEFLFVVSRPEGGSEGQAATLAALNNLALRLMGQLELPLSLSNHQLQVTGGCGLVVSQGEEDVRLLLERSVLASKRAKRDGRNRLQVYSATLEEGGRRRVQVASQLQVALEQDQLMLQYQPIFDLQNGQIWGVEALLRWSHPTLGTLEPAQFIDIALESGLIIPIGKWVVMEATKVSAHLEKLYLSLNLSAQELMQADFVKRFTKMLELSHVTKPDHLILEVPEKEFGPEADRIANNLKELRRWGIQVAIDDFTFDSLSLRRVQQLEVGHIKLDQIIVHNLSNPLCEGLARAAVQVGGNLKCKIWAEGLETAEQLQQLKAMGVNYAQGNVLCPPLPAGALRERLKSSR